jgi:hypothetical protein
MSAPWKNNDCAPSNHAIDRLVDGSLPEAERRALLLQLEAEPDGWRRCALAFLEAHMWREAFVPLTAEAPAPVSISKTAKPWRRALSTAGLAACIAAAFLLGWAVKPAVTHSPVPEMAQVGQPAPVTSAPPATETKVAIDQPPVADSRSAVIDSVLKVFEREGFSADRHTTHVTMKLRDGRALDVPAQEITLRYTGDRTY